MNNCTNKSGYHSTNKSRQRCPVHKLKIVKNKPQNNFQKMFMQDSNTTVHASHCCPIHHCKYRDPSCPIKNNLIEPEYPNNNGCEQCEFEKSENYSNE